MTQWNPTPLKRTGSMIGMEAILALLDARFRLPVVEGEDDVCSLEEAMRKHVKRGISIDFAGRGAASLSQLAR